MGLNDIQLTPALVHQLYCNSLVDINIINQKDTIPVPHLGKNEKQVLILVNEPGFAYLPDAGLLKLTEILNACLLSLADVAIVNTSSLHEKNYQVLNNYFKPAVVLCMGVAATDIELPIKIPNYQVQQYDHKIYLLSCALHELAQNQEEKKKLWPCLKTIFKL